VAAANTARALVAAGLRWLRWAALAGDRAGADMIGSNQVAAHPDRPTALAGAAEYHATAGDSSNERPTIAMCACAGAACSPSARPRPRHWGQHAAPERAKIAHQEAKSAYLVSKIHP